MPVPPAHRSAVPDVRALQIVERRSAWPARRQRGVSPARAAHSGGSCSLRRADRRARSRADEAATVADRRRLDRGRLGRCLAVSPPGRPARAVDSGFANSRSSVRIRVSAPHPPRRARPAVCSGPSTPIPLAGEAGRLEVARRRAHVAQRQAVFDQRRASEPRTGMRGDRVLADRAAAEFRIQTIVPDQHLSPVGAAQARARSGRVQRPVTLADSVQGDIPRPSDRARYRPAGGSVRMRTPERRQLDPRYGRGPAAVAA